MYEDLIIELKVINKQLSYIRYGRHSDLLKDIYSEVTNENRLQDIHQEIHKTT